MTCAEIKDRTIDYLYGELPEGERASFEQHLAGCQSCHAEVGALQGTLHQARAAVKLTDEPPPARVRVAVMEAARAAMASAPLAAARVARPDPKLKAQAGGFWSWLRGPWLMSLAGAAAAVTIFVLARGIIFKPAGIEEIRQSAEPSAAPVVTSPAKEAEQAPSERAAAPEPKPTANPVREGRMAAPQVSRPAANRPRADAPPPPATEGERGRYAVPPPARKAIGAKDKVSAADDEAPRDGAGKGGKARTGLVGDLDSLDDLKQEEQSRRPGVAAGVRTGAGNLGGLSRAEPAAAAEKKKQDSRGPDRELAKTASKAAPRQTAPTTPPPPPAVAPAPPAAPAPPRYQETQAAPAAESDAVMESAPAKPAARAKRALSPFEEQVQKADRLFTGGRWSEAATAYRELLRQYPGHQSATGWKGRLRACEQALQQ